MSASPAAPYPRLPWTEPDAPPGSNAKAARSGRLAGQRELSLTAAPSSGSWSRPEQLEGPRLPPGETDTATAAGRFRWLRGYGPDMHDMSNRSLGATGAPPWMGGSINR